ncbi:vitamin K epoxide reductase family protein [Chroococcus sp. FPU101]|uniref:vitamin K epoxide reductase family protein n=1 Tax=Chroococcus sp. FPU101 TaxID=1974212 RepID=UPI001A8E9EB8|nr:vitamin K epoxide reductase family protein [Chroococcus sp. FPU101]GFE68452.1 Vitamin K epoxide reductase [Chroococcus sp. FPU101]
MTRRRSQPWIQRYARIIMGILAVVGSLITFYLTIKAFSGGSVACPIGATSGVSGCDTVLSSPYAKIFGLPLSLFGLLAYLSMLVFALSPFVISSENNKRFRNQIDQWTWQLLLLGGTAMAIFSGYLMYIAFFVLKDFCLYCIGSALCSVGLFLMALFGREWEEMGQMFFSIIIAGVVTLVGALGLYANAGNIASTGDAGRTAIPLPTVAAQPPNGWDITTTSGESEIALAKHLNSIGAKEYGAFWCPHCYEQKQLFGKEAFKSLNYVECDPQGNNPQTQVCRDAGIKGFPTWEIKGQMISGTQTLDKLAELSGYTGPKDFKYQLPNR